MKHKFFLFVIGFMTLILLTFISLLCSYVLNGFYNTPWINWKAFTFPIVIWTSTFPLYVWWIHKKTKTPVTGNLASSNFMNEATFSKTFKLIKPDMPYNSNWVIKTLLNRKKEISFYQTKDERHALVIGSTGSGKTSLLLDANIQLFAKSNDQPTLIISDPKGELYNKHSNMLNNSGYKVIPINLRDFNASKKWNPLEKIWDLWFSDDNSETSKEKALNQLDELTNELFPATKGTDAFFSDAGAMVFQFFAILYLERVSDNKVLTKDKYNITNIIANIHQTTGENLEEIVKGLKSTSYALIVGGQHVREKSKTTANILQTVVTKLKIYNDTVIKRVTSSTNFKLDNTKPQVIFIIVPDESTAKYPFISLFVSEIYKELISLASNSPNNKLARKVYFLLDEFGNIPKIPQMQSMITVSRSRNVFFMLLLQNYSQLNEKYGNHAANTIISNCAYEMFLLTSDIDTARKFSQKLGQKSITQKSRSNSTNQRGGSSSSSESERTRQLLHPDELMKLKFGEFILSMQREDPIKSSLAKTWEWKGFKTGQWEFKDINKSIYKDKHLKNFITIDEDMSGIQKGLTKISKKKKPVKNEKLSKKVYL